MKKKIAIILAIVLVFSLSVIGITSSDKAYAKSAEMCLQVPDSVKKENEFTVTVVLESDVQLYSIDAYLSYNPDLLEFVPDNNCVTGSAGVLELKDVYGEETKKASYEITFKALETGMASISLTDVYLIDYEDLDYITVTASAKEFEIGVNKLVAEDARLSELIVAPGEFTEVFDANQLEYEMYVDIDVEKVGVSAIPMNSDSVVELEMPEVLQIGENIIKIKVTALSGNVNEYIVKVIREELEESPVETVDDTNITEEETVTGESTEEATTEEEAATGESTEEATAEEEAATGEGTEEATTEEEAVTGESTEEVSAKEEAVTGENTEEVTTSE